METQTERQVNVNLLLKKALNQIINENCKSENDKLFIKMEQYLTEKQIKN